MVVMKSPESIKLALAMREAFLVPFDFDEMAEAILALQNSISGPLAITVRTFFDNLRASFLATTLPYTLAHSKASALHLQRLTLAEKIRSLKGNPVQTTEAQRERDEIAVALARNKFTEFASSDAGLDAIVADLSRTLLDFLDMPSGVDTARQLLYQAILGLWSALEIAARDSLAITLNVAPRLAQRLLTDSAAKKIFELPRLSVDDLVSVQFDLSRQMGDLLLGSRDFSDLRIIRIAYKALTDDGSVARILGDDSLWQLNQARHLIAHRGGVIDARYCQQTGRSQEVGANLAVSTTDIEKYFFAVTRAVPVFISALRKLEMEHSSTGK